MEDIEGALPWSAVPDLIKIYEKSSLDYYPTYAIIQNWYNLHTFPENKSLFVTPNGEVDEYGTFAIFIPAFNIMVFESKNPDLEATKRFIKRCMEAYFKTSQFLVTGPVEKTFWPVIEEIKTEFKLSTPGSNLTTTYFMDKKEVERIPSRCPEEVYIDSVREEHAEEVNEVWPHKSEGSVNFIKHIIQRNGGVGVFLKENNELVAWSLHSHYNGPGQLHTKLPYRRKGYGELALIEGSKFAVQKGLHVVACVVDGNTPSHTLFNKLGFKPLRRVAWFELAK